MNTKNPFVVALSYHQLDDPITQLAQDKEGIPLDPWSFACDLWAANTHIVNKAYEFSTQNDATNRWLCRYFAELYESIPPADRVPR